MPFLIAGWVFFWGWFASYLNHDQKILDDPSSIYADALKCVPLFFCLLITRLYSGMLNNSFTEEEYRRIAWQDRLVDNAPEVIVFATCVIFFMHSY